ncbi:MAG TPA: hypothetical protein VFW28_05305 [Micropepsaceae bacterium]|nr:hypothetical protein [Micropepsaceae bacterium]
MRADECKRDAHGAMEDAERAATADQKAEFLMLATELLKFAYEMEDRLSAKPNEF